jgi:phosphatidylglycerophosphate synthase
VVSDAVDGIIARNCNLETSTGKWLDPLSDKLVYFIPLLYFGYLGSISLLGVIIFIVIDTFGQFSRILLDYLKWETKANMF